VLFDAVAGLAFICVTALLIVGLWQQTQDEQRRWELRRKEKRDNDTSRNS